MDICPAFIIAIIFGKIRDCVCLRPCQLAPSHAMMIQRSIFDEFGSQVDGNLSEKSYVNAAWNSLKHKDHHLSQLREVFVYIWH